MTADTLSVLVVDDVLDSAEALAVVLEMDGHTVRTAHNGAQALQEAQVFRPHCALLDINMPDMDGRELAAQLRKRFGADIVIIAVTGWGGADDSLTPAFADFDYYMRKPFDVSKLRQILLP